MRGRSWGDWVSLGCLGQGEGRGAAGKEQEGLEVWWGGHGGVNGLGDCSRDGEERGGSKLGKEAEQPPRGGKALSPPSLVLSQCCPWPRALAER